MNGFVFGEVVGLDLGQVTRFMIGMAHSHGNDLFIAKRYQVEERDSHPSVTGKCIDKMDWYSGYR